MESLSPAFVGLLRCPLTRLGVRWISLGEAQALGMSTAQMVGWSGALLRADQRALYPVRNGLPVMLAEAVCSVSGEAGSASLQASF